MQSTEQQHLSQWDNLIHTLHRAEQRAKKLFAEETKGIDVSVRQLMLLKVVAEQRELTQTDIVSLTGIDRSTITELVGRMVDRGLLTRQRNRRDARAYLVSITDEGRARLEAAALASKKACERFLDAVPQEHRNCFELGLALAADLPAG